jgi:hypothetical protein
MKSKGLLLLSVNLLLAAWSGFQYGMRLQQGGE